MNKQDVIKVIDQIRDAQSTLENALDDATDIFLQHGRDNKDEIWKRARQASYDAAMEINYTSLGVGDDIWKVLSALKRLKAEIEE